VLAGAVELSPDSTMESALRQHLSSKLQASFIRISDHWFVSPVSALSAFSNQSSASNDFVESIQSEPRRNVTDAIAHSIEFENITDDQRKCLRDDVCQVFRLMNDAFEKVLMVWSNSNYQKSAVNR